MPIPDEIRQYWDTDAATYDRAPDHYPGEVESAAWTRLLSGLLPPAPATVLDVGAGTGFLTLTLARLGYRVTALDIAPAMLAALRRKADAEGLRIETVEGYADQPPPGPFDAVVERYVVWLLTDPVAGLTAWRRVAPEGRLVLVECRWGAAASPAERLRMRGQDLIRRARRLPPEHHREFDPRWTSTLPLGTGTVPKRVVELVESSAWGPAQLTRLHDVERAARRELALPERLLGVRSRFAVTAGS